MQKKQDEATIQAEAATDRLQKSLRVAKSIVRDYKMKLCRKTPEGAREPELKRLFQFDR